MLNKVDLFKEKIKRVDLRSATPVLSTFTGDNSFESCRSYLVSKFKSLKQGPLTVIPTCATDAEDVMDVIKTVTELALSKEPMKSSFTHKLA